MDRVFLNPLFGEPLVLVISMVSVISANPALNSLFVEGRSLQCGFFSAKFPKSVLNFAVDFGVDFLFLFFFKEKAPKKST